MSLATPIFAPVDVAAVAEEQSTPGYDRYGTKTRVCYRIPRARSEWGVGCPDGDV